ncbi:4405_t:CDS:2 [Entrophospora sp. SA101]|nr:4405_t:CDS:2 [Entrophospora sp. SA101]
MESTTTIVRESAVLDALRNAILSLNSTIHGGIDEQSSFLYRSILHDTSLNSKEKSAALIQLNHLVDVYKVSFKDGPNEEWLPESHSLYRSGPKDVILKRLDNFKNHGNDWFEEAESYLTLNMKLGYVVTCYGITKDPTTSDYMIVMRKMDYDLKEFVKDNANNVSNLSWSKKYNNFKNHGNDWFEEAESYLTLNMKLGYVVTCYGITKDPTTSDYMIVMRKMDYDLKEFVKDNANNVSNLSWSKKYSIIKKIADCLLHIHEANSIHKNLHSGNVLYSSELKDWKLEILDRYYGEDKFEADEGIELLERKEEPCLMQSSRLYRFKNLPKPRNANSSNSDNNNNSNQQIGSCHKRNYSFQFSEDIYTVS